MHNINKAGFQMLSDEMTIDLLWNVGFLAKCIAEMESKKHA